MQFESERLANTRKLNNAGETTVKKRLSKRALKKIEKLEKMPDID